MISTMCSFSRTGVLLLDFLIGFCLAIWFMLFSVDAVERFLNNPHPCEIAFPCVDPEQGARAAPVWAAVGQRGVSDSKVGLHAARGLAARAHGLDHGGRAGDDVAAGEDARHRCRK